MDTLAKFKAAKEATDLFKPVEPVSEDKMQFLASTWLENRSWKTGEPTYATTEEALEALATFKSHPSPCGCMGARPGEPWCPCAIWVNMDVQKYNLGIYIIENNLQVP